MRRLAIFGLPWRSLPPRRGWASAASQTAGSISISSASVVQGSKVHAPTSSGTTTRFSLILDAGIRIPRTTGSGARRQENTTRTRLVDAMVSRSCSTGHQGETRHGAQLPVPSRVAAPRGCSTTGSSFYNGDGRGLAKGIGDITLQAKLRIPAWAKAHRARAASYVWGFQGGGTSPEPGVSLWQAWSVRCARISSASRWVGYPRSSVTAPSEHQGAALPWHHDVDGDVPSPGSMADAGGCGRRPDHLRRSLTFGLGMSARISRHLDFIVEGIAWSREAFQPEG